MSLAVLTSLVDALKMVLFCSTCNCKLCLAHNSFWGRNICIESDGFHFCISFKSIQGNDKKACFLRSL